MLAVESAARKPGRFGDDVAASIQANLRANIARILDALKEKGVKQQAIAGRLGWSKSQLSQLKNGDYVPSFEQLERFLNVLNEFSKTPIEPEDLFRNPEAEALFLEELARRAGYIKKS